MSKPPRDGIGARIAAARKAAGLSQREVADMLGVPPRTLSYYESAAGDLPSSLLVPLADVLGVEVCWLLDVRPAASCRKQGGKVEGEAVNGRESGAKVIAKIGLGCSLAKRLANVPNVG